MPSESRIPLLPEQPGLRLFTLLAILLMLSGAGLIISGLAGAAITQTAGFQLSELADLDLTNFGQSQRIALRLTLMISNLFTFFVPGMVAVWLLFRKQWRSYLRLEKQPPTSPLGLALLWLIVTIPLIQYSYFVNQLLPLPEWMTEMETQTSGLVDAMLGGDHWVELLLTLLAVAVVPALGEEVVFRGILQRELEEYSGSLHLGVWLSAFIFSAIHFQFAGFFPRFFLGALLGYCFAWSRNLWVPILLHFFFNGMQVIGAYFMDTSNLGETPEAAPNILVAIGSALLTFWVGQYFYRSTRV